MVQEGIVLGHRISLEGLEVNHAKISTIQTLMPPTMVKGVRSFLGHDGLYRRFIKDFYWKKDATFDFDEACMEAFKELKFRLISASIMTVSDLNEPFEIMCDASDFSL